MEALSVLSPTQVAELTLTSGALNDTKEIARVLERLEQGDAFNNVDEFLTQLTSDGQVRRSALVPKAKSTRLNRAPGKLQRPPLADLQRSTMEKLIGCWQKTLAKCHHGEE